MKKIFLIIILGLLLTNCAVAPSKQVQSIMIKDGSIKISMSMQDLYERLGGAGATIGFYIENKYLNFEPYTSNYGPAYFENKWYVGEKEPYQKYHYENYKLTKIFDDVIDFYEYIIPKINDQKIKNRYIAAKAKITGNSNYLSWKASKSKSKSVASKPRGSKSNSRTSKGSGGGSSGSAFFVTNRGHIITNYHVVDGCKSNPKIKYKDKDVEAKVIARDTALDLALLKADLRNTKYISLSSDQPKKLQRIIASGYPFGKYISDDLKFTSGIVSSLKGPGDDSTIVQVDAALNPGNSGGPIVDEATGKLVAVSVMGMRKNISEGQNFGIKTSSVKNFLETNKVKVPTSWFNTSDVAKLLEDSTLYTFCR